MSPRLVLLALALLAIPFTGGCGKGDSVPAHTAEEDKLIREVNNLTPQQQIERIQNGPMPASAKEQMIQEIKEKNGIK